MPSIETLAETLRSLATSSMKPKELLSAVREKHPEASKKEVVRAAFYALIDSHRADPAHVEGLHTFALSERASDEDEPPKTAKLRKKKHKKTDAATHATH